MNWCSLIARGVLICLFFLEKVLFVCFRGTLGTGGGAFVWFVATGEIQGQRWAEYNCSL